MRGPAGGAGAGAGGGRPAAGPAPPAGGWADLPRDLLEAVARAVPAGDRLWFRLVCRRWVAAGAEVAPAAGGKRPPPGEVTRTRGADAAASVARTKMVLGVLDGSVRGRFKGHMCLLCRGRAPRGPPVGAGKGLPLGRIHVRDGCQEWAHQGPPVGAGQWVPLGHFYVHGGCL